jgi:hypothetical protein
MAIGLEQSGALRLCRDRFARATVVLLLVLFWISYPIAEMMVRHAQGASQKESGISLQQYVEGKIVTSDSLSNETLVASFWASAKYRGQYPDDLYLDNIDDADYFLRWNKRANIPKNFNRVASLNVDLGPVEVWERVH